MQRTVWLFKSIAQSGQSNIFNTTITKLALQSKLARFTVRKEPVLLASIQVQK